MWLLLRTIKWSLGSLSNLHSVGTVRILYGECLQKISVFDLLLGKSLP